MRGGARQSSGLLWWTRMQSDCWRQAARASPIGGTVSQRVGDWEWDSKAGFLREERLRTWYVRSSLQEEGIVGAWCEGSVCQGSKSVTRRVRLRDA